MAVNPDTTIRKVISFPKDLWRQIATFRVKRRIGTEAETIRRLVVRGLAYDKLYAAFRAADRIYEEQNLKPYEESVREEDMMNLLRFYAEERKAALQLAASIAQDEKRADREFFGGGILDDEKSE